MPEDIDFGKLYEGLDQIPGLIENSKKQDLRDKSNAEKFKEIKEDVSGMKTEFSSLKTSIDSAKSQMQKDVTVQVEPTDVNIIQQTPDWMQDLAKEYEELKKKEKQPIILQGKPFFVLAIILWIGLIVLCAVLYFGLRDKKESWADRDYKAAVELKFDNPGSYYHFIIEKFEAGYEEEAKNIVLNHETEAKDHGKTTKKYEKQIADYLVNEDNFRDGIKVTSWETKTDKGKTVTFIKFLNVRDQVEWKVCIESDNHVAFTDDDEVNTLKDATRKANRNRKIWSRQGNFTTPYIEPTE